MRATNTTPDPAGVLAARADFRPATGDPGRRCAVGGVADAELAVVVQAPAPERGVRLDPARVVRSRVDEAPSRGGAAGPCRVAGYRAGLGDPEESPQEQEHEE